MHSEFTSFSTSFSPEEQHLSSIHPGSSSSSAGTRRINEIAQSKEEAEEEWNNKTAASGCRCAWSSAVRCLAFVTAVVYKCDYMKDRADEDPSELIAL